MRAPEYDAIVVGASFAGLAVARQLRGRVLLIDRKEIGQGQTSACGTALRKLEELGATDAVLQVHGSLAIHGTRETVLYDLGDRPFCTFDYRRLCEGLARGVEARFLRARVLGVEDGTVVTDRGRFRGRCVVDASGWRAVLAGSIRTAYDRERRLSFGVETTADYGGDRLLFWLDPALVPRGVTWVFPVAGQSRVGIASYEGESKLKAGLLRFLASLGLQPDGFHGGFFPWRFLEPTVGALFVVGDAAGHCLPVTGEGIRPALTFGTLCGRIVQQVIEGRLTLPQGLARYRAEVLRYRRAYRMLEAIQRGILTLPPSWIEAAFRAVSWPPFFSRFWAAYAGAPPSRSTGGSRHADHPLHR